MDVEKKLQEILKTLPLQCTECKNVSQSHLGHSGYSGHSHFEITFAADFQNYREQLQMHKQIYSALKPLYPGIIHSISLRFEKGL